MMGSDEEPRKTEFARDEKQAHLKFDKYKSLDPFPEILPALLNSADVIDYVRVTGMLWPFHPEKMKSASYEIVLLGKCVYWNEDGKKQIQQIESGTEFILKANSIAFVTVEPTFRLPDYMALRFNLKISHIYKGILLGTGPLVDPGYQGKLSVPLHNLTKNDYTFKGGDGIIWMEFTKLSTNDNWHRDLIKTDRFASYIGFPEDKNKLGDVEAYLEKAVGREGRIQSSIPDSIQRAAKSAEEANRSATSAKSEVETIRNKIRNVGIWAGVVVLIGLFFPLYFGFYQIYSLVNDSHNYVNDSRKEIDLLNRKVDEKTLTEQQLRSDIERMGLEIERLRAQTTSQREK